MQACKKATDDADRRVMGLLDSDPYSAETNQVNDLT